MCVCVHMLGTGLVTIKQLYASLYSLCVSLSMCSNCPIQVVEYIYDLIVH